MIGNLYQGRIGSLTGRISKRRSRDSIQESINQSHLQWCNEESITFVAYKGCQNIVHTQYPMHCALITHDEWPKIVDPPLMPIFMMGQGTWLYPVSQ